MRGTKINKQRRKRILISVAVHYRELAKLETQSEAGVNQINSGDLKDFTRFDKELSLLKTVVRRNLYSDQKRKQKQ